MHKKNPALAGFFVLVKLEGKIVDRLGDLAGGWDAGGGAGLRGIAFAVAAGVAAAVAVGAAAAAEQLHALDAEGEAYTGGSVILGIGPYFRRTFRIYLGAFLQVGGNSGAIGPVCTLYPDRLVLLVSLGVTELLGMRHVEVDDTLSIHGVGDTVLAQVSDYLKLDHNGKF